MKLPEPVPVAIVFATGEEIPGYTAEQMLAWGKACAAAEREECAKLLEEYPYWLGTVGKREIVATIRARGTT
jgi:hypothetical protein